MKLERAQFNLILGAALLLLAAGCASPGPQGAKVKHPTVLRLHLEVNPDGTEKTGPVTVNRSVPFTVNVQRESFLTEYHITDAAVVDDSYGGFYIRVQFNRTGTWLWEQFTTGNKGKRVAVFTQFDDTIRWVAAPVITARVADGKFAFTPDATREEADRMVLGLNELGKEVKHDDR